MRIKRVEGGDHYSIFYGVLAALFIFSPSCRGVLVNRTIDSQFGDRATGFVPLYQESYHSPGEGWDDQTCIDCDIRPDPARAFDGTWMAATYYPQLESINFTLQFTGVAIWVFFILSNANIHGSGVTTNTQCNFTLDGKLVGNFSHYPDLNTYDQIYNATVFSKIGLTNTSHQLFVSVNNDYPFTTFVNFDWAIYTADVDPSTLAKTASSISPTAAASTSASQRTTTLPGSSSSKIGIIVGCVVGILALVTVVIVFFIFRRRSAQSRTQILETFDTDTPYVAPMTETSHIFRPFTLQWPSFSTLPSSRKDQGSLPGPNPGGAEASVMRQAEINERVMAAQREINYLASIQTTGPTGESGSASSPSQGEITALHHQMEELRNQIRHLQAQQQPPAYA